jgi:hypothetical protein
MSEHKIGMKVIDEIENELDKYGPIEKSIIAERSPKSSSAKSGVRELIAALRKLVSSINASDSWPDHIPEIEMAEQVLKKYGAE